MRRKTESIITILISTFTVFTLLVSLNSYFAVNKGVVISEDRVGADVMILSGNTNLDVGSFLYSGESTNKYIVKSDLDFLKSYDEIDKMTEEFFTHTLSGGCCSVGEKLRIVGIDQDTDFVIKPWLEEHDISRLAKDEVLIGDDVAIPLGSKMGLLGAPFKLVGSLYRTGTGMDRTVYLDIDMARKLAKKKMQPSIFKGHEPSELVTAVFIKLKDGADAAEIVDRINLSQDKLRAFTKSTAIDKASGAISGWTKLALLLVSIVIVNAFLSLYGRFSFAMNERKKEIGFLRAAGFSRASIVGSILAEMLIFAIVAGLLSSIFTIVIMPMVMKFLTKQFYLPASTIDMKVMLSILIEGPILVYILSVLSVFIPAKRIIKLEPMQAISKGQK